MADRDEVTANFTAITGADLTTAMGILEATGYDLEQGVQLYFATHGEDAAQGAPPAQQAPGPGPGPAGAAQGGHASAAAQPMEEFVRAPLPVQRERLYGNEASARRGAPPGRDAPREVEAFRDFRAEGNGTGAGASSSAEAGGGGSRQQGGLAGLFEPPRDLMFKGDLEAAKEAALAQSKWLLVNVQSNAEFASHLLNRDTWRDDMVRSVIAGSFIFWQIYDTSDAGQKVKAFYRLAQLPVTMVVDPVTGAALKTFAGAIEAHRLVEDLVPYMDADVHDPGAAQLAAGHLKRKQPPPEALPQAAKPLTEEEELAMALAMSAEECGLPPGAAKTGPPAAEANGAGSTGPSSMPQQAPAAAAAAASAPAAMAAASPAKPSVLQQSGPEAALAAAARLPPEPEPGEPGACPLAVRFPDGQRRARVFPGAANIGALRDFCVAHSPEAAAGRAFALSEPIPGAPQLSESGGSLQERKLANALLVMRWVD